MITEVLLDLRDREDAVLVAGGIAGYADIVALREAGAEGAIIGRALLDGTMDLVETLRVAS